MIDLDDLMRGNLVVDRQSKQFMENRLFLFKSMPIFENYEKSKEVVTNENNVRPPFNEKVIKKDAF